MPLIPDDELSSIIASLTRTRVPIPVTGTRPGPAIDATPVRLDVVLAGRRSVRQFAERPVPHDELTHVIRLAEASQHRQWPLERHGDARLRLLVAAYQVDRLVPGLHVWRPEDGSFGDLADPEWLRDLSGRYASASALVLVCGSVRRAGARGYGGLLVRAGALGYAVWLAARSRGLECSVFGGAGHELSAALEEVDPDAGHLFTVAVGYASAP